MANSRSVVDDLAAYYGVTMTDAQANVYVWVLNDVDPDDLEAAAREHVRTCKWMPRVNELLELAGRQKDERKGADTNHDLYWESQELFNARLRGEIDDKQLYTDKAWKWYESKRQLVQREVAADADVVR